MRPYRSADPACADIVAWLQSELFDWAAASEDARHDAELKGRGLCRPAVPGKEGRADRHLGEAELGAIREKIGIKS